MQILIQLQAHPSQVQQLRHWCLHEWGPSLAHSASLQKVIVNVVVKKFLMILDILFKTVQYSFLVKNIF